MAKSILLLAAAALVSALLSVQAMGQAPGNSHPDFKASFLGSAVACTPTEKRTERFMVPQPLVKRARIKARLMNLLHESLSDDSKGIVNVAREKEITDLAKKLKDEKGE